MLKLNTYLIGRYGEVLKIDRLPSKSENLTGMSYISHISLFPGDGAYVAGKQTELGEVTEEAWIQYHRQLQKIEKELYDRNVKGWQQFDRVFMISAKNGDGVWDIKVLVL